MRRNPALKPRAKQEARPWAARSALKEPQPEILFAGAIPVARIEAAAECHIHGLALGKRRAQPRVVRLGRIHVVRPLHLELEKRPWTQQAMHFLDVVFDNFPAGNM